MFTTKPWNCRMDILSQCPMVGKKVRSISDRTRFTASFNIQSPFPTFPIKVERKLLSRFVVIVPNSVLRNEEAMTISEFQYQKVTITVTLNNNKVKMRKVLDEIKGVILTLLRKYSDYLDNVATRILVSSIVASTDENILELVVGYGIREMRSRKLQDLNDLNIEIALELKAVVEACEDCESVKIFTALSH